MEIIELTACWTGTSGTWRLLIEADGTPTVVREDGEPRPAPRRKARARVGARWTEAEEAAIHEGHAAGEAPPVIARRIERSAGAVRARMVRLGLLSPEEAGLRYPLSPRG